MKKKSSIAVQIGKGLAYIQDTIDIAFRWGFGRLREVKLEEKKGRSGKEKAKKVVNSVIKFTGEMGESFYTEYEKIKQNRISKK